jgi:hypothetical protein
MKVNQHVEMLRDNPRYAELCSKVNRLFKEMDKATEQLEKEFPLEDEGAFYCVYGVSDFDVRPTHG